MVSALLNGKITTDRLRFSPKELLRWVYQNSMDWRLRDVDIWLRVSDTTNNYRLWAFAFARLGLQRYDGQLRAPRVEFRRKSGTTKPKKVDKNVGTKPKSVATKKKLAPKKKKGADLTKYLSSS